MTDILSQIQFKDDHTSLINVSNFNVEVVENGFILEISFRDGEDIKEVYHSIDDVCEAMRKAF